MMEWFDSHCHVDEEAFDEDREEALARMAEHGITRYAVIGSDMGTSRRAIRFAREHAGAIAVGGIHPHEARRERSKPSARSGWTSTTTTAPGKSNGKSASVRWNWPGN